MLLLRVTVVTMGGTVTRRVLVLVRVITGGSVTVTRRVLVIRVITGGYVTVALRVDVLMPPERGLQRPARQIRSPSHSFSSSHLSPGRRLVLAAKRENPGVQG